MKDKPIENKMEQPKVLVVDGRTIEVKSFATELKLDESEGIVEGYASIFGNKDSYGDIVEPGAFTKTIKEFIHRVKVMWQHREPMGKPIEVIEDSKGLYTKSKISRTKENLDRLILMKDKVVNEMSIGFDTIKCRYDDDEENKVRHLTELKLWEYSFVTWGANDLTEVTGMKSAEDFDGILFKLNDMLLKGGKTMSAANRKSIEDAMEGLKALLAAAQPDNKSTDPKQGQPQGNQPDISSLVDEVMGPLKSIKSDIIKNELLDSLRAYGKKMRS